MPRISCRCCAAGGEARRSILPAARRPRAAGRWAVLGLALLLAGCAARPSRPSAPPAAAPPPAVGAPRSAEHRVQRGETLALIARRYGTDYETLARLNGLKPPYTIYPGQSLRLPGGQAAGAAELPAAPPGGWVWPTTGVTQRGYSAAYGGNKGLDIAGQIGQPVRAAAAGTVLYIGNGLPHYGNLLIVKHTDDYLSAYGYLQHIAVAEGSVVSRGQTIASMGSPGDGKGLLHFEIRLRGQPIDPASMLPPPGR